MYLKNEKIIISLCFIKSFIKWAFIASLVGVLGGVVGSIFHESVEYATHIRENNGFIILFLPLGGVLIALFYRLFRSKGKIDTNRVIDAIKKDEKVPLCMIPLIFISTVITHLLGGSAGREGAALQLGGSIGYNIGKSLKLNKNDIHVIVMSGMSAVFSALFGTPITAAFFSLEVARVGTMHYSGLLPCVISSILGYKISLLFGLEPVRFLNIYFDEITLFAVLKVLLLAVLCALVSIIFCYSIKLFEKIGKRFLKNVYLRALVGGLIIVCLTFLLGTFDYNGAGISVIEKAMSGKAHPLAFLLKILFTAITISAGFKGGEIVPTFFIGATFGCVVGQFLGLDAGFSAAIGFVALFCGVVNCPVASLFLAIEVFGASGILFFAIAISVSYLMSGYFGLYESQQIFYSKTEDEIIDIDTK